MKNVGLAVLFFKLREMLEIYASNMRVTINEEGYYRLYTPTNRPFMAICVQRKHVGIYVMPLCEDQNLIGNLEPKRIGKGTLGFVSDEDPLLVEVPSFIERCYQHCIHYGQVPME
ncbi:MAG: hypothetical protein QGI21_05840 [Candidatus Poseidoniaceae archaeon]|nr:hypothetical protein [Candidatus Poseidoniaceae archaeon]